MASETGKYNCAPCYLQGKVSSIYCFCIDCIEHLCETCLEHHNKFKVTRSHRVLQEEDLPEKIAIFKELAEIGVCNVHPERRIEYKCLTHQEFVCSACVKNAHRSCAKVEDIEKLPAGENEFENEFVDGLNKLNLKVEKFLLDKKKQLELLKSIDVTEQQPKFWVELENVMADLKHDVIKALDAKMKAERTEITACIEESTQFKDLVTKHIELADTVLKYGSDQQRTITKDQIAQSQSMIKSGLKIQEEKEFLLPPSVNVLSTDEVKRLRTLKTVIEATLKHEKQTEGSLPDDKENTTETATKGEKTTVASSSYAAGGLSTSSDVVRCEATSEQDKERDVDSASNSSVSGDSKSTFFESDLRVGLSTAYYDISVNGFRTGPCNHVGSILLEDENMVYIDAFNNILKLVSSDFRVISYQKLDASPYDLALVGDNNIVVAVGKSVRIFSITTDDRFVQHNKFFTKDRVSSVCPVDDNLALLYSAVEDNTPESSVQIWQLNSRIINNIYNLEDRDGNSIELDEPYIIRSRYPGEIIVSDGDKLMGFDRKGTLGWDYEHMGANIEVIAFDSENNIYYSDGWSASIHQISAKSSKKNRILIPDTGVKRPRSILINSEARTVIVGFEDNNAVQVYEFC